MSIKQVIARILDIQPPERVVYREVPVPFDKIVTVTKEVPVEVVKEVPVEVVKEVVKEVPVTAYKVIQVKTYSPQQRTPELKEAIKTLPAHPGFQAILDELALQRQFLESKSCNEFHKDLRESDFIQSGIYWLNYIQVFLDRQTQAPRAIPRDAMDEELEAFKKIDAQIERVGM